jgi:hypothetical protein
MASDAQATYATRLSKRIRERGTLFWAVAGALLSVGALFAGSQIAHDRGQSVDWYTGFGQWLGALGSFIAAGAALLIATRDRRDRDKERLEAHRAEATLVIVSPLYDLSSSKSCRFGVHYHNYGARPILDIQLAHIQMRAFPNARAQHSKRIDRLVRSEENTSFGDVTFLDETGALVPPPRSGAEGYNGWPDFETNDVVGWIVFSDVYGNRWAKSSDDRLRRIRWDSDLRALGLGPDGLSPSAAP